MCCLFGLLDYSGYFSHRQKNTIMTVLSAECEVRGADATGIAYNSGDTLRVYKRPLAASRIAITSPMSLLSLFTTATFPICILLSSFITYILYCILVIF